MVGRELYLLPEILGEAAPIGGKSPILNQYVAPRQFDLAKKFY